MVTAVNAKTNNVNAQRWRTEGWAEVAAAWLFVQLPPRLLTDKLCWISRSTLIDCSISPVPSFLVASVSRSWSITIERSCLTSLYRYVCISAPRVPDCPSFSSGATLFTPTLPHYLSSPFPSGRLLRSSFCDVFLLCCSFTGWWLNERSWVWALMVDWSARSGPDSTLSNTVSWFARISITFEPYHYSLYIRYEKVYWESLTSQAPWKNMHCSLNLIS